MNNNSSVRNIATENPTVEQWRLLSQFSYPSNARKYLNERGFGEVGDEVIELISGSIRQSQAYFDAVGTAPLDISPLLLYYGATSLLVATTTMLTGGIPPIENHGMTIRNDAYTRLADVKLLPISPENGALQIFCNVFSNKCILVGKENWTLAEIMGSIPDLKQDFQNHYLDQLYFTVPVEIVQTRELTFERIHKSELSKYPDPVSIIEKIDEFKNAYLPLQDQKDFIVLFRRENEKDIGSYSITGRKYLSLSHLKNNISLTPHQLILMYMGLYILGFLPRYRQYLWNPFVRSDTTGEKIVVEKFINVCNRYLPNLVLNYLFDCRVQFVSATEGVLDLTKTTDASEVKEIVRKTLSDLRFTGNIK